MAGDRTATQSHRHRRPVALRWTFVVERRKNEAPAFSCRATKHPADYRKHTGDAVCHDRIRDRRFENGTVWVNATDGSYEIDLSSDR